MTLHQHLALHAFVTDLLGGDLDGLLAALAGADGGRRPDGQSNFYSTFEQRASRLAVTLDDLRRYDLNILGHEAALASGRPGFRLKYFQYLAALYAELYLHRLAADPARLLLDLEAHRAARAPFADLPPYRPADLRKIALWMATGAGKTLLLHVNLRQFLHYRPFVPQNILLLTPTEALSGQHRQELALSGIPVLPAGAVTTGGAGVRVIEITKLYVAGTGARARKGGVSLPAGDFEGPNLLLVDEGHKGGATSTDRKTERAWRDVREALAGDDGFTFEYSATFAQVTESDRELFADYTRAILFEYAYGRFHADGYGKDYAVINLKEDSVYDQRLLLAGLLTLYEQRRVRDDGGAALAPYNLEAPLMIFVGAGVVGGPEVLAVVRFLDRVLRDRDWAVAEIGKILGGASGLTGEDNRDAFHHRFPALKELGAHPAALYDDLLRRVFRGAGVLNLHLLRRADGEIGLRTADSARDAYCGVINVGDAPGFLKKVRAENEAGAFPPLAVGEDDHLSASLFDAIDAADSPVALLIGSKKFIEGWSSWRVSVMGLLNVGKNAGAQVLQLFGRGIRLKGRAMSLRRSEALPPPHPTHLPLLETLTIFGLKANYLQEFFKTLRREGLEPPVTRRLPIALDTAWVDDAGLFGLETDPGYSFARQVLSFDPRGLHIDLDVTPAVVVGGAAGATAVARRSAAAPLPPETRALLPAEALFARALAYKAAKGWDNLYLSRAAVQNFFSDGARLAAPPEVLAPQRPEHLAALAHAAGALLEKALDRFHYQHQQRGESAKLRPVAIAAGHENFPADGAYQLQVPLSLVEEVDRIIADEAQRLREDLTEPLPRLRFDAHLFQPLLIKSASKVKSTPAGLEESEKRFIVDLRAFWERERDNPPWRGASVYLLRNQPKRGIGFFETAGFYPDFLLWLKRGDAQALAFADPHGLGRWSEEKVRLLADIGALNLGFPVRAFIVSPTPAHEIEIPGVAPAGRVAYLRDRHVLIQEDSGYIRAILAELNDALR